MLEEFRCKIPQAFDWENLTGSEKMFLYMYFTNKEKEGGDTRESNSDFRFMDNVCRKFGFDVNNVSFYFCAANFILYLHSVHKSMSDYKEIVFDENESSYLKLSEDFLTKYNCSSGYKYDSASDAFLSELVLWRRKQSKVMSCKYLEDEVREYLDYVLSRCTIDWYTPI